MPQPNEIRAPKDLPREELMKLANETLQRYPGAEIHFKFTCGYCGARCTLQDANKLWEVGQCYKCGHETEIERGGFAVMMNLEGEDK